jgi:hypothetical protein
VVVEGGAVDGVDRVGQDFVHGVEVDGAMLGVELVDTDSESDLPAVVVG